MARCLLPPPLPEAARAVLPRCWLAKAQRSVEAAATARLLQLERQPAPTLNPFST